MKISAGKYHVNNNSFNEISVFNYARRDSDANLRGKAFKKRQRNTRNIEFQSSIKTNRYQTMKETMEYFFKCYHYRTFIKVMFN